MVADEEGIGQVADEPRVDSPRKHRMNRPSDQLGRREPRRDVSCVKPEAARTQKISWAAMDKRSGWYTNVGDIPHFFVYVSVYSSWNRLVFSTMD